MSARGGPTRRTALRAGLVALTGSAAAAASGCETLTGLDNGGGNVSTESSAGRLLPSAAPLPEPFTVPLPVPPVLEPVRSDDEEDVYEITQRVGSAEILPGLTTEVWGYDGIFPGPTLVSRSGRRTVVTHRNELPVPVVVHLHGGRTAPEHDGFPTDLVLPVDHAGHAAHDHAGSGDVSEGTRTYVYEMQQPAATLWYHDHRMDFTGPQVYRGLAGFHLVRSDEEEALGLPSGERDVPLMIVDRAFAADGAFDYPSADPELETPGVVEEYMSGVLGDCVLVNGAPWPVLEVAAVRYRFRLLNASNARRYRLRLDGLDDGFLQIGSDLGLLAAPRRHDTLDIAQAERFDVVVDFSGLPVGAEVTLRNELGSGSTEQVMRFVVAREESDDSRVPERLAEVETLQEADVVEDRELVFARGGAQAHGHTLWTINGEPFSPDTVHARPALGTVERWRIRAQNVEHPFHVHLAGFQVLDATNGSGPGPFNDGWKDTVNLDNGGRADVLVRFDGYRGRYVLHCHNLEHEDMMMMATFEVV